MRSWHSRYDADRMTVIFFIICFVQIYSFSSAATSMEEGHPMGSMKKITRIRRRMRRSQIATLLCRFS